MKKINTYYVAEGYNVIQYNAGIVRNDNEAILAEMGFIALQFKYSKGGSVFLKLSRIVNAVQLAFSVKKNSLVLFHFPLLANAYKWFLQILRWREIDTVGLIIDVDGIRDNDKILLANEVQILQQFSYIIAHNPAMKKKLQELLPMAKIVSINLFDYPFKDVPARRQLSNSICFAGNLTKSKFIYSLHKVPGPVFNVYGVGYDAQLNINGAFNYKGMATPTVLPSLLEGSFGLVWDGDAIEKCDDYLRYNNPHKLSLYLVAGLPVIVWKESAVADLVEVGGLGICIDSLADIPGKLNSLTPAEYETMQQNARLTAEQINKGTYLRKVTDEIKNQLNTTINNG